MSLDNSTLPITNSATNQLDGIKGFTSHAVSSVQSKVKELEEQVALYNNKATKNKDEIVARIKTLQTQISEKINSTVSQVTDRVQDVTTTVAQFKTEADTLYTLISPLTTPPGANLGDLKDFCTAIVKLAQQVASYTQTKKVDAAGAVVVVASKTESIQSDVSELKSLLNKANSISAKFK